MTVVLVSTTVRNSMDDVWRCCKRIENVATMVDGQSDRVDTGGSCSADSVDEAGSCFNVTETMWTKVMWMGEGCAIGVDLL
jgi:hypothetical protein